METLPKTQVQPTKKQNYVAAGMILVVLFTLVAFAINAFQSIFFPKIIDPLQDLQTQVEKELHQSNRDVKRISEFDFDASSQTINITIAGNDNLTEAFINRGFETDIINTLKTIYQSNTTLTYKSVSILITLPTVDKFGNIRETKMFRGLYLRATLDMINFENVQEKNIFELADPDTLYLHPSVNPF